MTSPDSLMLNDGNALPQLGLGFWKVSNERCASLVTDAFELGYRHFDCASDYGNEAEVGQGLTTLLSSGDCYRNDLWLTSKLWNTYHRPEHVRAACERTLSDLKVDYLDLYLIHFPIALAYVPFEDRYSAGWFFDPESATPTMKADPVPIIETWRAVEALKQEGLVKSIGVCNFGVSLLRDLMSQAEVQPAVLQIESHPHLAQEKLLRFCSESGIAVTAFSPLGAQSYFELGMADRTESLLANDVVNSIASSHEKTAAQILLRWGVQRGTSVVPKTSSRERLQENAQIFDFELSDNEMKRIGDLNLDRRYNDPGDFCEKAFNTFFPIYE